jgi:hypothetical protein
MHHQRCPKANGCRRPCRTSAISLGDLHRPPSSEGASPSQAAGGRHLLAARTPVSSRHGIKRDKRNTGYQSTTAPYGPLLWHIAPARRSRIVCSGTARDTVAKRAPTSFGVPASCLAKPFIRKLSKRQAHSPAHGDARPSDPPTPSALKSIPHNSAAEPAQETPVISKSNAACPSGLRSCALETKSKTPQR